MTEKNEGKRSAAYAAAAAVFWLLVWELLCVAVGSRVILPGPLDTLKALARLVPKAAFWRTVGNSFLHIVTGFLCAVAAGILLAAASYRFLPVKIIFSPVMKLIRAVPVASFIILVLLWINSRQLPTVISFLMVLPVIYANVLTGIESTDSSLLEMAQVFRMGGARRIRYIYVPAVMPYFLSAVNVALGFSWKSGVAAEVIGLSPNAIGTRLYEAKLYLLTDELFAWTAVIVLVSVIFEKAVMAVLKQAAKRN